MESNGYLAAGLAAVWAILMAYVLRLGSRLEALERQIGALEAGDERGTPEG